MSENDTYNTRLSVPDQELTGQDRIARNVLASWGAHLVLIVAGFILPRMIDRNIGQSALGVWDFGWSLTVYFMLLTGGVVSSVNRYVAKYRAVGDTEGVNRVISSSLCIFLIVSCIFLVFTGVLTYAVPVLLKEQLADHVTEARWVVLFLGLSLSLQMLFAPFGGILTGCHRWDIHHLIYAGSYTVTVIGMIVILLLGGGLPALAAINLVGDVGSRLVRCVAAYRVYPALRIRPSYVQWSMARQMIGFGGKSLFVNIADAILKQTTTIVITAHLGLPAVAVFSRPMALIRHVRIIIQKFAFVFTPTASSLQVLGRTDELRKLLLSATRYAGCIALPMILFLTIMGGPFLRLWMGSRYEQPLLMAILALGHVAMIIQWPAQNILAGMNMHGRPGLAYLICSIWAIAMVIVALGPLGQGLVAVAVAVAVPLTVANGVYVPIYVCRRLDVRLRRYVREALIRPLLYCFPFGVCLAISRIVFIARPFTALLCGAIAIALVLVPVYWRYVLPQRVKVTVREKLPW